MAILVLGDLVTGIRGSVGGVTYSANGSGPYCKAWSRPSNQRAVKQGLVRGFVGACGRLWASLSSSERGDWDTLAASPPEDVVNSLGETVVLSGFQWFGKLVVRQLTLTNTPTLTAPGGARPDPSGTFTVAVSATGACTINHDGDYFSDGDPVVFAGVSSSAGLAAVTRGRRALPGGGSVGYGALDIRAVLLSVWPVLPVGGRCTVWFAKQAASGLRSVEQVATVTITA